MTIDELNAKYGKPTVDLSPTSGSRSVLSDAWKQPEPQSAKLFSENNVAGKVGNALTSSEQGVGNSLASGIIPHLGIVKEAQTATDQNKATATKLLQTIRENKAQGKDTSHLEHAYQMVNGGQNMDELYKTLNPESQKSTAQAMGEVAGVGLDVLSAGSYGNAAKGAETGKLLTKGGGVVEGLASKVGIPTTEKAVTTAATQAGKQTLGQTLKGIGIKTAERATVGAGTGYAYDVSNNFQQGKTGGEAFKPGMGTVLGAAVPTVIGGVQAGVAMTRETAPRFINSLIKPKQADFSYGKNPGRTVSEMGITGNNLSDFTDNIHTAKQDVGQQLGSIYTSPENASLKINASDEIKKIDNAITEAAKGGKENQGIVTTLQNTKDALLYEHGIDKDGNIVKVGDTPRDLTNLSPKEVFDLKSEVASHTKFTGNPSDDKTVNSVLKNIYGGLKEKLNTTVGINNPEVTDLNEKYADLTSAELATRNRSAIVGRSDMVSLKSGAAGALATVVALLTGAATLPAALIGISGVALEKAMETTAVKTRIASWLGSESPSVISKVLQQNPGIKTTLYRSLPKLASKIGR